MSDDIKLAVCVVRVDFRYSVVWLVTRQRAGEARSRGSIPDRGKKKFS
jgi:hypothetical protein